MPELAEVETVCSQLHAVISGRALTTATVHRPVWVRHGDPSATSGQTLRAVRRWGKRLWWQWDEHVWVGSLGMTGSIALEAPSRRHPMLELSFDGLPVTWYDPRHFGSLYVYENDEAATAAFDAKVGIDAAGAIETAVLRARFAGTRAPIKAALLNQRWIAGVGNYLADEMLWAAMLHPATRTRSLTDEQWEALNSARETVIERALTARGLTVRDYRDVNGERGEMAEQLRVYGRAGEPCLRCGDTLVKSEYAGRGTTWCPTCQPESVK
jgi:formamidopyrimidine-DNA glycosylase